MISDINRIWMKRGENVFLFVFFLVWEFLMVFIWFICFYGF